MIDQARIDRLTLWLTEGAQPPKPMPGNVLHLVTELRSAGVPVDRLAIFITSMHPTAPGRGIYWTPETDVVVQMASYEFFQSDYYKDSPVASVRFSRTPERVRMQGDVEAIADRHPDYADLIAKGVTDYYMQPLLQTDGDGHGMSYATLHPDGFTDAMLAAFEQVRPGVERLMEIYSLKLSTHAVLSTYVGRDAGRQVLAGKIQRGDSEAIDAVILFADLKGFTALSNVAETQDVLSTLNAFFDAMDQGIQESGGEILKFMGDGVLAIFPTVDQTEPDAALAATQAISIARESLPEGSPGFRAALHAGKVVYGNIGATERLDFTVIGPAVNLTARLLGAAADIDAEDVCSERIAKHLDDLAIPAGSIVAKGFPDHLPIFRLNIPRAAPVSS